jgi:uncharacterized protein
MDTVAQSAIGEFLLLRRIAIVGVSRNPADFSRHVYQAFRDRGFNVVPVNPNLAELDGAPCYPRVSAIQPPVLGALLMTPRAQTESVVRDCADAGIARVWMHRGGGQGAVSEEAVAFCRSKGMSVVEGECPLMYLPRTGWFHQVHGVLHRIFG